MMYSALAVGFDRSQYDPYLAVNLEKISSAILSEDSLLLISVSA